MKFKDITLSIVMGVATLNVSATEPDEHSTDDFANRVVIAGSGGSGTTVIRNSRNGFGNRIIIDGEEIGVGTTEMRPRRLPVPTPKRFWRQRVLNSENGIGVPLRLRSDETLQDRAYAGSKLDELVRDPIVRMYVPPHILELLESLAAEHLASDADLETTSNRKVQDDE